MDILLTFLAFVVLIGLIVLFLIAYTRRIGDLALTEQFRAAESISEGYFPASWVRQIQYQVWLNKIAFFIPHKSTRNELAIRKLDQLYKFFEHSKFFETDQARALLLAKLLATRERWKAITWDEIVADQPRPIRKDP